MVLSFVANNELLESLQSETAMSPEDLLIFLEDMLEAGELSLHDVRLYLIDLNFISST